MVKQICSNGHDTSICGRGKYGHCLICRRLQAKNAQSVLRENVEYRKKASERYKNWRKTENGKKISLFHSRKWIKSDKGINYRWKQQGILINGSEFTVVDYDRAYQIQQGRCAGCKKHQAELGKNLVPDHSHPTGEFRFLLCYKCNSVLGYVSDSPELLENLALLLRSVGQK